MWSFVLIIGSAVILNLGLFGLGCWIRRDDAPAAAALRGWTVFLLVVATAWFAKFPADWLAPVLWVLLAAGLAGVVRVRSPGDLIAAIAGTAAVAGLFALPFLLYPHLLAYAHLGTDQWGYIGVAQWLRHHSVDVLPAIDDKPGRDWIWHVLTTRERPLVYLSLAAIAGTFGGGTALAYYVLPAAMMAAVFLAFAMGDFAEILPWRGARAAVGLLIAAQPIVLLHFQHQFLGGTIAAIATMLLAAALLQIQATRPADPLFFATAALFAVLSAGLYSIKIALVSLAMLAAVFGLSLLRREGRRQWRARPWPEWVWIALAFGAAPVCFGLIRRLAPEPLTAPMAPGRVGHIWAQFGAIFGQTDVTAWYQPDGAAGWLDPVRHFPPGSRATVVLLIVLLAFCAGQAVRWLWIHRDATPLVILTAVLAVGWFAAPPHGSHWTISRALPVYGGLLLVTAASTALLPRPRWACWLALVLAALPLVRAAPGLWPFFVRPVYRMVDGGWTQPPRDNVWGALGYAFFYEDARDIDWSQAPECFKAMTYYMPADLRPKLKLAPRPPP